ncbi:thioredoxin-like isoform X2 [Halichondria panicea]|uniref:thioredoxin-like isoform X2 n=1 Tax=Halichondria panicea TaxID=6063 RepID=UPI00312B32C8
MPEYLKTKNEYDQALKDAGNKLVVIDFTAAWCGPCKVIGPKFEAMSLEFTDVKFYKVDVDDNDETAEHVGISAMPTFNFYKNSEKVDWICDRSQ